ncbi:hypothetical protein MBANPS3_012365 [Mucor bainieri]
MSTSTKENDNQSTIQAYLKVLQKANVSLMNNFTELDKKMDNVLTTISPLISTATANTNSSELKRLHDSVAKRKIAYRFEPDELGARTISYKEIKTELNRRGMRQTLHQEDSVESTPDTENGKALRRSENLLLIKQDYKVIQEATKTRLQELFTSYPELKGLPWCDINKSHPTLAETVEYELEYDLREFQVFKCQERFFSRLVLTDCARAKRDYLSYPLAPGSDEDTQSLPSGPTKKKQHKMTDLSTPPSSPSDGDFKPDSDL